MSSYYIIAAVIVLICIVAIIFALRVLKDTREMESGQPKHEDEERFKKFRHG
jgi:hypothetical protein